MRPALVTILFMLTASPASAQAGHDAPPPPSNGFTTTAPIDSPFVVEGNVGPPILQDGTPHIERPATGDYGPVSAIVLDEETLPAHRQACARRYRSYDAGRDSYRSHDGQVRTCRLGR